MSAKAREFFSVREDEQSARRAQPPLPPTAWKHLAASQTPETAPVRVLVERLRFDAFNELVKRIKRLPRPLCSLLDGSKTRGRILANQGHGGFVTNVRTRLAAGSKRPALRAASLLLAAAAFSGCGGQDATPAETINETTGPTAQTPAKWKPLRSSTYGAGLTATSPDATTIDGASSQSTLDMGEITPATLDDVDPEFTSLLENCDVDFSVDAAIPMRTTVENTSDADFIPGLTIRLEGLKVTWPGGDPGPLLETKLAGSVDGGSCEEVSQVGENSLDVNSTTPITKSAPFKSDWLWIIKDYFSVEYADGQPAKLSSVAMVVTPWVKGSGEGRASHLKMAQSCFTGAREFEQLWGVVAWGSSNVGFRPYTGLGDPKNSESLLTPAELEGGVPSDADNLDEDAHQACV